MLRSERVCNGRFERLAAAISASLAGAQAHEAQRRRAEELSALDHAKTVFFSNVSHEFRTPLTLIAGPLDDELAEREQPMPEQRRERLAIARRNTLRLLKLVNNLLDFSRLESGRMLARYRPTALGTLTSELSQLHGGDVRVESREGRGSVFTVSVPFGSAHLPSERLELDASAKPAGTDVSAYVQEALLWAPAAPVEHAEPSPVAGATAARQRSAREDLAGRRQRRHARLHHGAIARHLPGRGGGGRPARAGADLDVPTRLGAGGRDDAPSQRHGAAASVASGAKNPSIACHFAVGAGR